MRLEWNTNLGGRQRLEVEARRDVETFYRCVQITTEQGQIFIPIDYVETLCAALRAESNIAMLCRGPE